MSEGNGVKRDVLIEKLAHDAEEARTKLAGETPIRTEENPLPRLDALYRLTKDLRDPALTATVYFVPDKHTLGSDAFSSYLDALKKPSRPAVLAARILADFSNELVPRFVQVRVESAGDIVLVEERRPKWDNPAILARIPPI